MEIKQLKPEDCIRSTHQNIIDFYKSIEKGDVIIYSEAPDTWFSKNGRKIGDPKSLTYPRVITVRNLHLSRRVNFSFGIECEIGYHWSAAGTYKLIKENKAVLVKKETKIKKIKLLET